MPKLSMIKLQIQILPALIPTNTGWIMWDSKSQQLKYPMWAVDIWELLRLPSQVVEAQEPQPKHS